MRLVDRVDRSEAHRAGRELPELRHQIRMAVRAQALTAGLLPVVRQVLLGQPPFEKRPRIDSRRGVRLEVNEIPVRTAPEEMIEPDLEQNRRGGVARYM